MKYSKSAEVSISLQALITLMIAVVILILSATALNSNRERVVTVTEDLACQAYLQTYSSLAGKVLSIEEQLRTGNQLFAEFTKYCKTGRIYIEGEIPNEIFEEYAEASRRCWQRYGSGEMKFLDFTQREGSYCFVCAKVSFEDRDFDQAYRYRDLGVWMEQNKPEEDNEEGLTYKEASNLFYTNYNGNSGGQNPDNIRVSLTNMLQDDDLSDYTPVLIETSELVNYLYSVETRVIHPEENQFVVFRYNLDDSGFETAAAQVATGVVAQAALGFGVKKIACYAAAGIVTATGLGAPVGAAIAIGCSLKGAVTAATTAANTYRGVNRIGEIQEDIGKFYPNSLAPDDLREFQQYRRWLESNDELRDFVNNGGRINIPRNIEERLRGTAQYDELVEVFDNINSGRVTLSAEDISSNSQKFQNIRNLISTIVFLQTMLAMENSQLPNFEQYTEIIPESEFYEACGNIPNYDD